MAVPAALPPVAPAPARWGGPPARLNGKPYGPDNAGAVAWGKIALFGGLGVGILASLIIVIVVLTGGGTKPDTPKVDDLHLVLDVPPGAAKGEPLPAGVPVALLKPGLALPPLAPKSVKSIMLGKIDGHPGVDNEAVNNAIDRGVEYFRKDRSAATSTRAKGLVGLTLLSCGAAADDPLVQDLAAKVRSEAVKATATYEISTFIWFLDKLGDPADRDLIRKLALRLVHGQETRGGWNYMVSVLDSDQEVELLEYLQSQSLAVSPAKKAEPPAPKKKARKEIASLPVFLYRPDVKVASFPPGPHQDNSLTQFAVLALWRAKDYGVPVDRSLAFAEARFRESQNPGGAWGYAWGGAVRPDSMTCSGLMGLAVGKGSHLEMLKKLKPEGPLPKDEGPDPAIEAGLRYLGGRLKDLSARPKVKAAKTLFGAQSLGDFYFLWSLERMAVVYDLRTIGETDWYAWGVPYLLKSQLANGSWSASPGERGVADTCFALLFLRRANIAHDLTLALHGLAVTKDAGERGNQGEGHQGAGPQGISK